MTQQHKGSDLVKAGSIESTPVAEDVRARLDAAGITASLQADPQATEGVTSGILGTVDILVPAADLARAQHILAQVAQENRVADNEG